MEKVSAIVAIYKSEKFLPKLIDSIINQTWQNLEILLVDDGSPDNSGAICDDYASRDDRIRVIHKKNGGACEARNVGLAEATGEYILIIDGDDWLELDYVAYLMNLIHQPFCISNIIVKTSLFPNQQLLRGRCIRCARRLIHRLLSFSGLLIAGMRYWHL